MVIVIMPAMPPIRMRNRCITAPASSPLSFLHLCCFLLLVLCSSSVSSHSHNHGHGQHGHGKSREDKEAAVVNASSIYTGATARSLPLRPWSTLPASFDWCDVDGTSYCTASWNQHIPKSATQPHSALDLTALLHCPPRTISHSPVLSLPVRYCGSCWVHGALAAANDRIKVLMEGRHDVMLARQVLLNCGASKGLGAGCDGGESFDVFEYMKVHRYTASLTAHHHPLSPPPHLSSPLRSE